MMSSDGLCNWQHVGLNLELKAKATMGFDETQEYEVEEDRLTKPNSSALLLTPQPDKASWFLVERGLYWD